MTERYIPIYLDWLEETEELTEQERGRLVDALVRYARGMSWQESIRGNERYLFKVYQGKIDRAMERHEAAAERHRESGRLGGRPRKDGKTGNQKNQTKPNGFFENQNNLSVSVNVSESVNGNVNENGGTVGGAPKIGASPASAPSGFEIPLNDGTVYAVPQADIERYRGLYPAVDVEQQLRAMAGWSYGNPANRKTRGGVKRFIVNWLNREQNKARSASSAAKPRVAEAATGYTQRQYTEQDLSGFYTDVMNGEGDE